MKSTGRKYSKHFQQREALLPAGAQMALLSTRIAGAPSSNATHARWEVRALPADPADAAREMLTKDSDSVQ